MQNRSLAIFYCGTNGAGKSTLRSLNEDSVQIVIDSDHIAMRINPKNPRLADIQAGRQAIELFQFAINHNIPFSMESTLSGKSILQRMKTAKENGFYIQLNYIAVKDVSINIARVNARIKVGGHFIDEQTIRKRFEISNRNLLEAISLSDEAMIFDNSDDLPEIIFHIKNNVINQISNFLPKWCKDVYGKIGFRKS